MAYRKGIQFRKIKTPKKLHMMAQLIRAVREGPRVVTKNLSGFGLFQWSFRSLEESKFGLVFDYESFLF